MAEAFAQADVDEDVDGGVENDEEVVDVPAHQDEERNVEPTVVVAKYKLLVVAVTLGDDLRSTR